MATKRFGYLDDFTLKNTKVGIGTSTANEKLEVLGGTRGGSAVVTGIATLSSYSGFVKTKTSFTDNVKVDSGESASLSGEIVIGTGTTLSVGTGATSGQGSVKSLKVSNTFTPPIGGTNDRPTAPQSGALFYNKDFKTIEYWDGSFWRQVDNTTQKGRGVFFGGYTGAHQIIIDFINIQSRGNAVDFGQLSAATRLSGGLANSIRGINAGGINPGYTDTIEYITMASSGNPIDFGNLTQSRFTPGGAASSTRGVFMGGYTPSPGKGVNTIDYVEIMSLGNAIDFGDDQYGRYQPNGCSSPTRGIIAAGQLDSPATLDVGYVDYITIASKGNATTFGELGINSYGLFAAASSTRGVFGGSQLHMKSIHYITMASTGNGIYFGDLSTPFTSCASGTVNYWQENKSLNDLNVEASYSKINISTDGQVNFRDIIRDKDNGSLSASLWVDSDLSNFENINFSFDKNNDQKFEITPNTDLLNNEWLKQINDTDTNYSLSAIKIGNNNSGDVKIADVVWLTFF